MKLKPIGERVILKPLRKEERTSTGIYLPESDDKKKEGEVVSVGTDKDGRLLQLNKGDRVIYGGYSHEEIEIDKEDYIIVDFKDILAKIEGGI